MSVEGGLPSNHLQILKRAVELAISNRMNLFHIFYDNSFYTKFPCLKKPLCLHRSFYLGSAITLPMIRTKVCFEAGESKILSEQKKE